MQNTDLSLQPYFDDFNEGKNFYRVLFKPNKPVQTRELNTLQSILQHQIQKFGQHIFKDGSVVIPGQTGYDTQYTAVLMQSTVGGSSFELLRENLTGTIVRGTTTNVTAKVLNSISASESEKSTATLYVKYMASGNVVNGTQFTKFANNEILVDEFNNQVGVTASQNASDFTGSVAYITPGVYFIRGFFVNVPGQQLILDQYSNLPSYKIGLSIQETIVSADVDSSLYDNAVGAPNFTAPGADRLKIEAVLAKQDVNFSSDSTFIELLRLESGKIIELSNTSIYNELDKNLARITYDESGNYTINQVSLRIKETYNNGENGGIFGLNEYTEDGRQVLNRTPGAGEDNSIDGRDYYTVELDPLKAYVKGFEVENTSKKYLTVEKPRVYDSANNRGSSSSFGNYFVLDPTSITGSVNPGTIVYLQTTIPGSSETQIGKARVLSLVSGGRLFLADLTIFAFAVTAEATPTVLAGDSIFGSNGSTAVVESISGNVLVLSQISGQLKSGLTFTNSRNSDTFIISSLVNNKIENITDIVSNSGFYCRPKLEEVSISGKNFTIQGGNLLSGSNTNFSEELRAPISISLDGNVATIDGFDDPYVELSNSPGNGSYYNVKKLVPKLKTMGTNFFVKFNDQYLKSSTDMSYYKTVTESKFVASSTIIISTTNNFTLSANDILVTNADGVVSHTATSNSSTSVTITVDSNLDGTTVIVTYKLRVNNPSLKTKSSNKFNFLSVNKAKNSSNLVYGTRYSDNELSLKFPDVYKIHAIHEALASNDTNQSMFDSVVINNASQLAVGDILTSNNISARIISISGSTLYIKYLSPNKFQSGSSLAINVNVIASTAIVGRFITSSTYGKYKDVTSNYRLVKNDGAEFYNISKLVLLANKPNPVNKLIVVFDYYIHQNTNNDFYSTNSYDVNQVNYSEIPNTYDGTAYTDIVDFRYETIPSSGSGGTLTTPYQETISAMNYYALTRTISGFASPGDIVSADYDYYLGRIDRIFIDENGNMVCVKGSAARSPQPPADIQNALSIATVNIPPYMKTVSSAYVTIEQSKRYTMKDIGSIDRRLGVVEELTSLNLLEIGTNSLSILDEEGNDRFKTGFMADNFKSTNFADLNNIQYTACIDTENGFARPYPCINNVNLEYLSSGSTATKTGGMVTIPFTEVEYITQPYASRVENLQPFEVITWSGDIVLSPNKDVWFDTIRTQREVQQVDLSEPFRLLFDSTAAMADEWDRWNTQVAPSLIAGGGTLQVQQRPQVDSTFSTVTQDIEVGDSITGITSNTFVRSRIVDLSASKLKPNTLFHFFVGDRESNSILYPKDVTGMTARSGEFLIGETVTLQPTNSSAVGGENLVTAVVIESPLGSYSVNTTYLSLDQISTVDGSGISPVNLTSTYTIRGNTSGASGVVTLPTARVMSDTTGWLYSFIIIPPNTFETGKLTFKLSDQSTGTAIYGLSSSNASTVYDTLGTTVSLTSNVLSLDTPQISAGPSPSTRVTFVPFPPPPPAPPRAAGVDPIAQSLYVDSPGGIFVSSVDLYFQSKDSSIPVSVEIRTMENGTLTNTVVPNGLAVVNASNINISANSSAPTRFTFPSLVYLNQDTFYAFVVKSDSKEYTMWLSRLAEVDLLTSFTIDKQPYSGSLFKSQNMNTWTADQFEDVKFVLNRAKFNTNTTYVCKLSNSPVPDAKLNSDSLKFTQGSTSIQVYHPNHCMNSIQNYVRLSSVSSDAPDTTLNTAITTTSQLGNITVGNATAATWGTIGGVAISQNNPGYVLIDNEIIKYTAKSGNILTISERGVGSSSPATHSIGSVAKCYSINGIPLTEINTTSKINEIIDLDRYTISSVTTANSTSIAGGNLITASRNIQYEEVYPNINVLSLPSTNLSLGLTSVSGNNLYGPSSSFALLSEQNVENKKYIELSTSRLVASPANSSVYFESDPQTMIFNLRMSTELDNISPMVDISGSSAITVYNRVSKKMLSGNIDISAELTPTTGTYSSYITKKITLQNTSTSIKVLLDAVRKYGFDGTYSDIKVFVKINGEGNLGDFNTMNYIEVPAISYPKSSNSSDYRSFDFEISNLPEFKEYAVKVCMISGDHTNIPKLRNFRAIALAV